MASDNDLENGIDINKYSENVMDAYMPLSEFVLFMGMFGAIILTNANLKSLLLIYKTNYPNAKISLLLSKTKTENSR